MSLIALIFSGLFFGQLTVAQSPSRVGVIVDVSNVSTYSAILSYDEGIDRRRQILLRNVQLTIGGVVYFPRVHISAYLDEISGTAICRKFGYSYGVLGSALNNGEQNTFSMNIRGTIEIAEIGMMIPADRHSTSEVLCTY